MAATSYELKNFNEEFSRLIKATSVLSYSAILKTSWFNTPVGPMIAIANEEVLYLLEFAGRRGLEKEIKQLTHKTKAAIVPGQTLPIHSIKKELELYFKGKLKKFCTPLHFFGTSFQKSVWEELAKIPFGETRSYLDVAAAIGRPTAFRAAASANGANQLAIIIPCHRVINTNGQLGGYAAGLLCKKWLLNHEKGVVPILS